jgi:hypothetical protein
MLTIKVASDLQLTESTAICPKHSDSRRKREPIGRSTGATIHCSNARISTP